MRSEEMKELLIARGYEVAEVETVKNGIKKKALQLVVEGNVRPVMYPELCSSESDLEEYLEKALDGITDMSSLVDTDNLSDVATFYQSAELCLESRDNINEETEYVTYTTEFYDLVAYIRVFLNDSASFKVTEKMLETWELGREEAYNIALENSRLSTSLVSMENMIFGMEVEPKDSIMNIITNDRKSYCGGAILSGSFQKFIKRELGAKHLYVLPSSIHELIIIRADDDSIELGELIEMVYEINNTVVEPEDKLSDNAYLI